MSVIKDQRGQEVKLDKFEMRSGVYHLPRTAFQYLNFSAGIPLKGRVYAQYRSGAISPAFLVSLTENRLNIGCFLFNKSNTKKILKWAGIEL